MSDEACICDFAGHDYMNAGGGLEICTECRDEHWASEPTEASKAKADE